MRSEPKASVESWELLESYPDTLLSQLSGKRLAGPGTAYYPGSISRQAAWDISPMRHPLAGNPLPRAGIRLCSSLQLQNRFSEYKSKLNRPRHLPFSGPGLCFPRSGLLQFPPSQVAGLSGNQCHWVHVSIG